MQVLIAIDSFKEAASSLALGQAVASGFKQSRLSCETTVMAVADGGEGTLATLRTSGNFVCEDFKVRGLQPGSTVLAHALWLSPTSVLIESAEVVGLPQIPAGDRNPERIGTYGLGQLMLATIRSGARQLFIGLGGTATQDLGIGLLRGLGFSLLGEDGQQLHGVASELGVLKHILPADSSDLQAFAKTTITLLCDVDNPLFGPNGTAHTYAAQKGADAEMIQRLELNGKRAAKVLEAFRRSHAHLESETSLFERKGFGAAGGIPAAIASVFPTELKSGAEKLAEFIGFGESLKNADLLVTGEGSLDAQTSSGKLVSKLAGLAKAAGVPVIAVAGRVGLEREALLKSDFTAAFAVGRGPKPLVEALATTLEDAELIGLQLGNVLAIQQSHG